MVEALAKIPALLAGEYFGLTFLRQTKDAFLYRAKDGLGDPVRIIEMFREGLCLRNRDGTVSARSGDEEEWSSALSETGDTVSLWSRMSHPALNGIDQAFEANGTLYVVLRDVEGQTLDRVLPNVTTILEPRQMTVASELLIDLLAYMHAFGGAGLKIVPEALLLDDQDASVCLSLQGHLDGTIRYNANTAPIDDCRVLARTLHTCLTGKAPGKPHKPGSGGLQKLPRPLADSLDTLLSTKPIPKTFTARSWRTKTQPKQRQRFEPKRWQMVAAGSLFAFALGVLWFGATLNTSPVMLPQDVSQSIQIPGAGAWQMDLPLQIIPSTEQDGRFILRETDVSPAFRVLNPWIQDGLIVTTLNGAEIDGPVDLRALAVLSEKTSEAFEFTSLTVQDPALPLQQNVAVIPYLWREKSYGDVTLREEIATNGWQIVVAELDPRANLPLRAGDILVHEQTADRGLPRFSDLDDVVRQLAGTANPSLTMMVRRQDNSRLVVGFAIEKLLGAELRGSEE